MNAAKQIQLGFKGYGTASRLIFKRRYAKFLVFPLILNILLFWLGLDFALTAAEDLREFFIALLNLNEAGFWGAEYLGSAVKGLVSTLVYLLFIILFVFVGGYIIIIVLSPIFSVMAEKIEKDLNPETESFPFNIKQLLSDVFRGIGIAIRNLGIETGIFVAVFILGFIPLVGWLGPIVLFMVSAYFFGFSFMDYTMERHRLEIKQSIHLMRKYKWTAITNGAVFALFLIIPYCGVAISAFAAVWSVIAGTASAAEIIKAEQKQSK